MTLTDFLLQRLAEDEERARDERPPELRHIVWSASAGTTVADRVLADVEAKRRIVEQSTLVFDSYDYSDPYEARKTFDVVLRLLAAPYADHPDFDPTWRP